MINSPRVLRAQRGGLCRLPDSGGDNPLSFFLPGLNPFTLPPARAAGGPAITGRKVSNPLNIQYWSMTPYLLRRGRLQIFGPPGGPPSRSPGPRGARLPARQPGQRARARRRRVRFLRPAAATARRCRSRIPPSSGARQPRRSSRWRGCRSPGRVSTRPIAWPSARTCRSRPGMGWTLIGRWAGSIACAAWSMRRFRALRHEINGTASAEPAAFRRRPRRRPGARASRSSRGRHLLRPIPRPRRRRHRPFRWADSAASNIVIDELVALHPQPAPSVEHRVGLHLVEEPDRPDLSGPLAAARADPGELRRPIEAVAALFAAARGRTAAIGEIDLPVSGLRAVSDRRLYPHPARTTARPRPLSNHEIDLCPLYGRTEAQTDALRLNERRGRAQAGGSRARSSTARNFALLYLR